MTADNPTVDDLRLVARNLKAEGHTSRALILNNAADKLERLEAAARAVITDGFEYNKSAGWMELRDGDTTLDALAAALEGAK